MLLADHTPLIFLKAVLHKLVHSWTLCPIWLPSYWKDFLKVTERLEQLERFERLEHLKNGWPKRRSN